MSTKVDHSEKDFMYIIPYCYAQWATTEALKRGLLESIQFRQEDKCLSGIKLTFNNGDKE